MGVQFTVTSGPHAGRDFTFDEHATFLVGRSSRVHFALPVKDPYVSRFHFLVEINPPLCRLRDMGSANGTLVNGVPELEADLKHGDRITIGETTLSVSIVLTPEIVGGSGDEHQLTAILSPQHWNNSTLTYPGHSPRLPSIPAYNLVSQLGQGGMGTVYRAIYLPDGTPCAIKTILPTVQPTPVMLGKFLRETEILRELQHPGIVAYRDSGEENGLIWFAMELVRGKDAERLARETKEPLAVDRVVGWILQLLDALRYAHQKGYVHRDIKPANLLVAGESRGELVKLADFGLARAYEASQLSGLTVTGTAGGTPVYMPPEQILDLRSVKPAADQYAVAVTMYRLLTGEYPFSPRNRVTDLFKLILESNPVPMNHHRADLPAELVTAVTRAMAREARDRFPDVSAFAKALRPFQTR